MNSAFTYQEAGEGGDGGGDVRESEARDEGEGEAVCEACEDEEEEDDYLQGMLRARRRRDEEYLEMRDRVADDVDALMDNGVRIDPRLRAWSRRQAGGSGGGESDGGEGGTQEGGESPLPMQRRCPEGHEMELGREGGAGLACDGGCGRSIRRGATWWSCAVCDLDLCMACCGDEV